MATGLKTRVRSNWAGAVLVCAKCTKKVGGGFGPKGRTPLAKALRKHLHLKKGRMAALGIVEVKCLGLCPRDGVTVVNAADTHEWLVVQSGAALDEIADELKLVEPEAPSAPGRMTF